jgi:hypothetical protein
MRVAANYEIRSDCSIVEDGQVLRIRHARGLYNARIQNIPRSGFDRPFLLSLHIYFEAPRLEEAKEIGEDLLADCLNMLAFATGAGLRQHRIRQIVDATPGLTGMRSVLMWGDSIEYEDPQPYLDVDIARSVERLMEFECPPAVRRALRWYRIAINEEHPDDQFMSFWFALEILAEHQKSPEKVPDRCPRCRSPLFCESCKLHPEHRPYAKQGIVALLKAVDPDCTDTTIALLDKSRNSLMHGTTLREVEAELPDPHEQIVDVLGQLVWKALMHQFPKEMFDGRIVMGFPSTFVHYSARGIAHLQTVVHETADGELDLGFRGMSMKMEAFGPPQSARPSVLRMTADQYERLVKLSYAQGEQKDLCKRVAARSKQRSEHVVALVLATDMATIKSALEQNQGEPWVDLFREIMK